MRIVMRVCVVMMIGGMIFGCAPSAENGGVSSAPEHQRPIEERLAKAPWMVKRCIANAGGLAKWGDVSRIETTVLLSLTGPKGAVYHNCFEMRVFLFKDKTGARLVATAPTPHGKMVVALNKDGEDEVPTSYADPERAAAKKAFAHLIRRVSGPFAMLAADEPLIQSREPVRLGGHDCIRVTIGKDNTQSAYYLDAKSGELLYVTEGGDYPNSGGTITAYTMQELPLGVKFPKTIRIMKIGENVLLGDELLIEAEFQKVELKKVTD